MPYASNDGVRIYYEVEGDGPPLLLLHGTFGTSSDWREFGYVEALRDRYQLVLLDLRGHGLSDKPHDVSSYDWPILVEDATCVLNELSLPSANVLGYSAGSYIATGMAMSTPERVHSLVLGGASNKWAGLSERGRQLLAEGMEPFVRATLEAHEPLPPAWKVTALANDAEAMMASLTAPRCTPSEEQLLEFDKPVCLYVGEADPRLGDSKEMASHLPNGTLVTLPEISHVQGLIRSDLVLPHLKAFLSKVAASD